MQHNSGNKKAEDEADEAAQAKMKEIQEAGSRYGDKVVEELVKGVMDVKPEVPGKASAGSEG